MKFQYQTRHAYVLGNFRLTICTCKIYITHTLFKEKKLPKTLFCAVKNIVKYQSVSNRHRHIILYCAYTTFGSVVKRILQLYSKVSLLTKKTLEVESIIKKTTQVKVNKQ